MKKTFLTFIALLSLGATSLFAQENGNQTKLTPPSDNPDNTFTYDIDEVQNIIFDRLNTPTEKNDYVKVVTADTSFPSAKGFSQSAQAQFKKDVRAWIEANPDKIEKLLKEKKKNEQSNK